MLERGLHAGFAVGVHADFDGVVYYLFYSYQYSYLSFSLRACFLSLVEDCFYCIFVLVLFIIAQLSCVVCAKMGNADR
eukprot:6581126-Ditylum_brightwellii.AAC.1